MQYFSRNAEQVPGYTADVVLGASPARPFVRCPQAESTGRRRCEIQLRVPLTTAGAVLTRRHVRAHRLHIGLKCAAVLSEKSQGQTMFSATPDGHAALGYEALGH